MAKKILERYGDESIGGLNVISVAVDAGTKRAVFSSNVEHHKVEQLILVDDMICECATIRCAVTGAEDVFVRATIHSGVDTSYPRGRIRPSQAPYLSQLAAEYYRCFDLTESGELTAAREVLIAAAEYASAHSVTLQPGWFIMAALYFEDADALLGPDPYASNPR